MTTGIQIAAAAYLLWISTAMSTSNLRSSVVFKFTPLVLGILLGFDAFKSVV